MLLASAVVVWEWLNEHGRWRPYSPAVCHHIEAVIRSDPRCGSVVLGQVDSRLSPYIIDLHSMHQFRQDTGEKQRGAEETHGRGCNGVAGPEVEAFLLLMCVYFIFTSLSVDSAPEVGALVGVICSKVASYLCRNGINAIVFFFNFRSPNLISHRFLH